MRLRSLIEDIVSTASALDMVARSEHGDVYVNWNAQSGSYGAVNVDVESLSQNGMYTTADLILYYGDRLTPARDNVVDLYEDGLNVLQSVINTIQQQAEEDGIYLVFAEYTATPFTQKFADELAGVWARVSVTYQNEIGQCATV